MDGKVGIGGSQIAFQMRLEGPCFDSDAPEIPLCNLDSCIVAARVIDIGHEANFVFFISKDREVGSEDLTVERKALQRHGHFGSGCDFLDEVKASFVRDSEDDSDLFEVAREVGQDHLGPPTSEDFVELEIARVGLDIRAFDLGVEGKPWIRPARYQPAFEFKGLLFIKDLKKSRVYGHLVHNAICMMTIMNG